MPLLFFCLQWPRSSKWLSSWIWDPCKYMETVHSRYKTNLFVDELVYLVIFGEYFSNEVVCNHKLLLSFTSLWLLLHKTRKATNASQLLSYSLHFIPLSLLFWCFWFFWTLLFPHHSLFLMVWMFHPGVGLGDKSILSSNHSFGFLKIKSLEKLGFFFTNSLVGFPPSCLTRDFYRFLLI